MPPRHRRARPSRTARRTRAVPRGADRADPSMPPARCPGGQRTQCWAFDDTHGRCVQGSHMMRIAAALLAVFAVATGAAAGPDAVPSPSLETEELVYDAGKVSRGVTVTHAFLLKNVGTGDLSVDAKPG